MSTSASAHTIIAFDLYGTLVSTSSIASLLSKFYSPAHSGASLAATWRTYQLEYTWRLNSMGLFEPFSTVTRRSLLHTLREAGIAHEDAQIEELMRAYDSLGTFDDVRPALERLKGEEGITAVVFSNGTKEMVGNSVRKGEALAPHADVFKDLVVVEEVRKFKPAPEVYTHLARKMGKDTDEESMGSFWLVSGNPFDVVGARAVGMQAAWVDRAGNGWTDELVDGSEGRPTIIVKGLGEVVDAVRKFAESRA